MGSWLDQFEVRARIVRERDAVLLKQLGEFAPADEWSLVDGVYHWVDGHNLFVEVCAAYITVESGCLTMTVTPEDLVEDYCTIIKALVKSISAFNEALSSEVTCDT